MAEENKPQSNRPGGCFLEAVRAFAFAFLLGAMITSVADYRWWRALLQGLLAAGALIVLTPRPGWILGCSTVWFMGVFMSAVMALEYAEHENYAERTDLTFLLCLGLWSCMLAIVLIRKILGQGDEQPRRLRAAAGYVIPPLEAKPVIANLEEVLLRPVEHAQGETLLRLPQLPESDPSRLLHIEESAALALPAAPTKAPDKNSVNSFAGPGRDYVRLATQVGCAALVLTGAWRFSYHFAVEVPRDSLCQVAYRGDLLTLHRRLMSGADVDTQTANGDTLLMLAAQSGSLDAVRLLIDSGADLGGRDGQGRTVLMFAAIGTSVDIAQTLLAKGAPVNKTDSTGITALMYAVRPGGLGVVSMLLSAGADARKQDANGEDALMRAASADLPQIARQLLRSRANAKLCSKDGGTALMAASIGSPAIVQDLIAAGAEVDRHSSAYKTALIYASELHHPDSVRILLKAGASPQLTDEDGLTPLLAACQSALGTTEGVTATIDALLKGGASPNERDRTGATGLFYLVRDSARPPGAIELLLAARADVNARDHIGRTPLMQAAEYRSSRSIETLLHGRANPNIQDNEGKTALMYAAYAGDEDSVRGLLVSGAGVNVRSKAGESALGLVEGSTSYSRVAAILRAAGATR